MTPIPVVLGAGPLGQAAVAALVAAPAGDSGRPAEFARTAIAAQAAPLAVARDRRVGLVLAAASCVRLPGALAGTIAHRGSADLRRYFERAGRCVIRQGTTG